VKLQPPRVPRFGKLKRDAHINPVTSVGRSFQCSAVSRPSLQRVYFHITLTVCRFACVTVTGFPRYGQTGSKIRNGCVLKAVTPRLLFRVPTFPTPSNAGVDSSAFFIGEPG
jgi:hypothetical protein